MRLARPIWAALVLLNPIGTAYAQTPSVIGGKLLPSGTTGHHFGVGMPSSFYEWWNGGDEFDWALHAGLVYDDWSGEHSDVDIGLDLEASMRFLLAHSGPADVAFRFAPGLLLGEHDHGVLARQDDHFILGLRPEMGVLVSVELGDKVNLATGGVVPVTVLIDDHETGHDVIVVIPLLPRAGIEVQVSESLVPWALLEMGPTIGIANDDSDMELGIRFWVGVTWYP